MRNYNLNNITGRILACLLCFLLDGCAKQNDWLDKKSNKSAVVPETIADFQALLDNTSRINNNTYTTVGLVGSNNFYLTDVGYAGSSERERNLYTWNKTIWTGGNSQDWTYEFAVIELANIVLDGLEKIKTPGSEFNNVKGQALFHRAWAYYYLAQLFCKPYTGTSENDLGLPIRLTPDVNIIIQRSNLKALYQQIIDDATGASKFLPKTQPYLQRPSNAAANALLSKTYLNMEDYGQAADYATKTINLHPQLLDYNDGNVVSLSNTYRFSTRGTNNPEVLFYAEGANTSICPWTSSPGIVLPELYKSYSDADLRKTFFYAFQDTDVKYRGAYSGSDLNFTGLAIDEIYLVRAECYARTGKTESAMADINTLLAKRFVTGLFVPLTATDAPDALKIILQERRKELPFVANLSWEDLRRLNKDTRFEKVLTRTVNGVTYTLPPNDKRYVLPIPENEIQVSGIQQNER